jgi:hypothetical protein
MYNMLVEIISGKGRIPCSNISFLKKDPYPYGGLVVLEVRLGFSSQICFPHNLGWPKPIRKQLVFKF